MIVDVWFRSLPQGQAYLFVSSLDERDADKVIEALEIEFNVEAWKE